MKKLISFYKFNKKIFLSFLGSFVLASSLGFLNFKNCGNVFVVNAYDEGSDLKKTVEKRIIGFEFPVYFKSDNPPIFVDFLVSYLNDCFSYTKFYDDFKINPFKNYKIKKEKNSSGLRLKFVVKNDGPSYEDDYDDYYYDDDDDDYGKRSKRKHKKRRVKYRGYGYRDDDYYDDDYNDYDDDDRNKYSFNKDILSEYKNYEGFEDAVKAFKRLTNYFFKSNFFGEKKRSGRYDDWDEDYSEKKPIGRFKKYFSELCRGTTENKNYLFKEFQIYVRNKRDILEKYVIPSFEDRLDKIKSYKNKSSEERLDYNVEIGSLISCLNNAKPEKNYLSNFLHSEISGTTINDIKKVSSDVSNNKINDKKAYEKSCDILSSFFKQYSEKAKDILKKLKDYNEKGSRYFDYYDDEYYEDEDDYDRRYFNKKRKRSSKKYNKYRDEIIDKIRRCANSFTYFRDGKKVEFDPVIQIKTEMNGTKIDVKSGKDLYGNN